MSKPKQSIEMDAHQFFLRNRPEPFTLRKFLYNPQKRTIVGRDRSSWAKIGIFYTIFYGILAALVAICMWVFSQTLDPRIPKWQLEESIIGTNPGLGFRPLPPKENVESTLIWYRGTDYENYKYWTQALDEFLLDYKTPGRRLGRGQNMFDCDYNSLPPKGLVCDVDINSFSPCIKENNYSFHRSSPCVFLKLNKIYGWNPDYYNETNMLPDRMPNELKEFISKYEETNKNMREKMNVIWVSCEGENPADQEYIGPVSYYPTRGFPGFYYPYQNSEGYLSPLVAVHFERPTRGILINIECKAWARNIHHDRKDRVGSVHFELMID